MIKNVPDIFSEILNYVVLVQKLICNPLISCRVQFMFIIQGVVEVDVSDGEKRRFEPGSVVLLEDVTGKGHTTEAVGSMDHISVAVPVPK